MAGVLLASFILLFSSFYTTLESASVQQKMAINSDFYIVPLEMAYSYFYQENYESSVKVEDSSRVFVGFALGYYFPVFENPVGRIYE